MGQGESTQSQSRGAEPWLNCAPQPSSQLFAAFKRVIEEVQRNEKQSIAKMLETVGVDCAGASDSDRHVSEFIIKACTSAILCEMIYLKAIEIETELKKWCQSDPGWFHCEEFQLSGPEEGDQGGPAFGVFKFASGTYVIMRGTVGGLVGPDWAANLDTKPACFLKQAGFVHRGFLARAKTVPLDMISKGKDKLIVAGHSLGGAAALLAAVEILCKWPMTCAIDEYPMVFTFGQPSCFFKHWPDSLSLQKLFVRTRAHRFYFEDDVVPALTGSCEHACPENLIRLSDGAEHSVQLPELRRIPAPGIAAFDAAKHSMQRYRMAMMNVACPQPGSVPPEGPARCKKTDKFPINITEELTNNTDARGPEQDGRFLLKVEGKGEYVGVVKASLCNTEDPPREIEGVRLTDIAYSYSGLIRTDRPENMKFQVTFDVSNANFSNTIVNLSLSNGFHATTKPFNIQLNNIAFIGKMSHGKSHLIRALKAYAQKTDYPAEEPRLNLDRNDNSSGEVFTHKTYTFYEVGGIGNDAQVHMDVVSDAILKFPPRVIVFVWKAGEAFDTLSPDLDDMVKKIMVGIRSLSNPDAVKVVVVLTKCDMMRNDKFKACYETNIKDLRKKFDLPESTRSFMVNSADVDADPAKVFGVDKLYELLHTTLSTALPLREVIEITNMWRRVVRGGATVAICAGVAIAGVGLALGATVPFVGAGAALAVVGAGGAALV